MHKAERHEAIRELVQSHRVASQEFLRELLAERGFDVAQATQHSKILRSQEDQAPINCSPSGHYPIGQELLLLQAKVGGAMNNEWIDLAK